MIYELIAPLLTPVDFTITGGQVHDATAVSALTSPLAGGGAIVADKGYDSTRLLDQTEAQASRPVIQRKHNFLKNNADLDRGLYRYRHLVENILAG